MTVAAGLASGPNDFQWDAMAGFAIHVDVRAGQREIGLGIVVELPAFPRNRVVTIMALVFKVAVVKIIFGMTRMTAGFSFLVRLGLVAIGTCN